MRYSISWKFARHWCIIYVLCPGSVECVCAGLSERVTEMWRWEWEDWDWCEFVESERVDDVECMCCGRQDRLHHGAFTSTPTTTHYIIIISIIIVTPDESVSPWETVVGSDIYIYSKRRWRFLGFLRVSSRSLRKIVFDWPQPEVYYSLWNAASFLILSCKYYLST